ncbi:MAG: L-threonylcarbamoyladenylate synthase [Thiohalorhabdus sp.]|uniref:L-threonylcarbamoyladenylate synthase n=1 Tax=Thiohalorhabdus sp. TaxID=3094134 RepID=UPI00397E93F5
MRTIEIRPQSVQPRTMEQVAEALRDRSAVIAFPTDTGYAFGCAPGVTGALKRIQRVRGLNASHTWTLLCGDESCLGTYARMDTAVYRMIKRVVPGPYTFVLEATAEVPRQLQQKNRKTIGVRISADPVVQALVRALGGPLVTTTARLAGEEWAFEDAASIGEECGDSIDLLLDAGPVPPNPSTVVDLTGEEPEILRYGAGDPGPFGG